jgi:hypothetical protein
MKKYIGIVAFLILGQMHAQTGIGTTTPHASAKLEVNATDKGFLPPRVILTSTTDATTIASPAEGLLVYNLGSVGLQAGYYYWNGANWATIATGTTAGNAVIASDMVKLYGETHSKANNKIGNATTGFGFTVPVSGRYLFDFTSGATALNGGTNTIFFTVRQGTTVLASDTQSSYNNNVHVEYNGKLEVNLQAGISYNVYNYATSGSFEINDYDRVYYKMVAGNLPVNQHLASRNMQLNNNYLSNDGDNEGIRIDNSGKVGIGTATPTTSLHIENGNVFGSDPAITNSPSMYIYNNNNASTTAHSSLAIRTNGNGGGNPYLSFDIGGVRGYSMGIDNTDDDKFKFFNNWNLNNSATPAFTITNDTKFGIGTTTPASKLHIKSTDATTLYIESTTSDNNGLVILNANTGSNWNVNYHEFMMFQKQGSSIGFIGAVANSNSINYSTTSDYRLKTDLQDYSGLNLVNKIKTYDYAWKSNNYRMHGVMAHELQEVVPYAVSGEKDAIDKAGKILPQAVDYSKLTPILVKAIQEQDLQIKEQHKQIEALIQRMEQLEAKKE